MSVKSEQFKSTETIWKSTLHSALRTCLACIIVGCTTLYGPESITQVAFPSFSYLVVILILTNATLGDTIRGCWQVFYATVQTVCPALLCLSIVGPTRFSATSTSLVLAVAAFFITLPECTHIVAKRIALGQLVLIYVVAYINAEHTETLMHPFHVAASTALGALASLVALLLPFPHLASSEVKHNSNLFAEIASERLKIFVKAFCAEDGVSSQAMISQAKWLAINANKFVRCIKARQESMYCEKFLVNFLRPYRKNPGDRLQELVTSLRGMEIAINNSASLSLMDERLKDEIDGLERQINQHLEQIMSHIPCETSTVPEPNAKEATDFLRTLQTPPSNESYLPSYFFLFCMRLLHTQSRALTVSPSNPNCNKNTLETHDQINGTRLSLKRLWANCPFAVSKKRLIPALKSSLSLGLAVFFGLYYSKANGFWAGLPVAISLAVAREPTFKVTNVKFQGTVIGSVYGVLGRLVFMRYVHIRFLALLPWFIFTRFLQQSKMYGQAGAVSAAIGAILILGRKNFGPPSEFAVTRTAETFIGLTCAIIVELILRPTRAASLAKTQLSKSFGTLHESLTSIDLLAMSKAELLKKAKGLKLDLSELEKCVLEAEVEPNFWFIPFQNTIYKQIQESLMKMADTLVFIAHALGLLEEQFRRLEVMGSKDVLDKINGDIKLCGKMMASSIKCFEEVTSIKSLLLLEKELAKNGKTYDVELGKTSNYNSFRSDENDVGTSSILFIEHLKEVCEKIQFSEDEEEIKSRMIMSWSAIGFCMNCLMKETIEVEKGVKEIVQHENPKSHINLREISCKIHALYN
ncbi:hypothetical protein RND81_01G009200 [Saponaria officinalis]|uniref:Integral membrane bound transporter domain-containing protein n=1 Tax=Saponaria officinalis TaxID=3572 RepID=A0AAW1ND48_SAPOF